MKRHAIQSILFLILLVGGIGVLINEFYHRVPRVEKHYSYDNPRVKWVADDSEYVDIHDRYTYHIQVTRDGWFTYSVDTLKRTSSVQVR